MAFHLPNDVERRVTTLAALELDPLVINEDGTSVNCFAELAAEVFKKPRASITFEERNEVMRAYDNKKSIDAFQEAAYTSSYTNSAFQNQRAADFIKRKYGL